MCFFLSSPEVTVTDYTNYDRLTKFLGCSREILGASSVLCLSFPLSQGFDRDEEVDTPLRLMTSLSLKGNVWLMLKDDSLVTKTKSRKT